MLHHHQCHVLHAILQGRNEENLKLLENTELELWKLKNAVNNNDNVMQLPITNSVLFLINNYTTLLAIFRKIMASTIPFPIKSMLPIATHVNIVMYSNF